ncbi:MAG: aminotransferase class I/II-fold pyridoxal phosphate-dependent enzyme [Anaerolineae bacterium]
MTMPWAPFELERFFARYEFEVAYVLCASDCETMTVRELTELEPGGEEVLMQLPLGYTKSSGSPALREAIRQIYTTVDSDEVLVHAGAEEAIFLFMHGVLTRGDHVIVHWPCYQSLAEVAQGLGCSVSRWMAREDDGWALEPDDLRALIRPKTRVVVINTPHNPTGYQMSSAVYREIVTMAEEAGCWLFSDEVYRESEYDARDRLPAACDFGERTISLGVMSKTYGLPGLRIGWVATHDRTVLERMAQLKDYTTICSAAPSEFLAELALRHRDVLVARTAALLATNLPILADFIKRHRHLMTWHRPGAGPIAFPRLVGPAAEIGDRVLCEMLARDAGVLLLPGSVYGIPDHVRVGFGRRNFAEGLAHLGSHLAKLFS